MTQLMGILFLLWAGLLFGGFIFGALNEAQTHRMPTWARMASSLTLAAAAWAWWAHTRSDNAAAIFITAGMTLGFIGDLFLAQLFPVGNHHHHILGGMGAFGLGHIAYISGLLRFGGQAGYPFRWDALIIWLLIGGAVWYLVVYRNQEHTILHRAALPYALLLASTTGVATGYALQTGDMIPMAVGAGLFLLSDLILAAQLFNGYHFRMIGDLIWLTYGPGQMLIVFTFPLPILL
jgi:hypothetical protein